MSNFKNRLFVLFAVLLAAFNVYADSAKQVDFLLSGYADPVSHRPLSGGKVWTYLDGTSTLVPVWTDKDKGGVAANPFVLDSAGKAEVYGDNIYTFRIYDSEGVFVQEIPGLEYKTVLQQPDVDTIAALRLSPGGFENQSVWVLGYYTPGDGGGGPLRIWKEGRPTGTYVDNGGSVIVPTGGDGSAAWLWDSSTKDTLPEEWGADGVSDQVEILSALNAGYNIRLSKSPYSFSGPLIINSTHENTIIEGSGYKGVYNSTRAFSQIKKSPGFIGDAAIIIDGTKYIELKGFQVDGSVTAPGGGIIVKNSDNVSLGQIATENNLGVGLTFDSNQFMRMEDVQTRLNAGGGQLFTSDTRQQNLGSFEKVTASNNDLFQTKIRDTGGNKNFFMHWTDCISELPRDNTPSTLIESGSSLYFTSCSFPTTDLSGVPSLVIGTASERPSDVVFNDCLYKGSFETGGPEAVSILGALNVTFLGLKWAGLNTNQLMFDIADTANVSGVNIVDTTSSTLVQSGRINDPGNKLAPTIFGKNIKIGKNNDLLEISNVSNIIKFLGHNGAKVRIVSRDSGGSEHFTEYGFGVSGNLIRHANAYPLIAPLSSPPANPQVGTIAVADRVTWDPDSLGSGGPYVVWYNGSGAWTSIANQ